MQGEGSKSGYPAVFVRFAGCNLWSGLEKHRSKAKGHCGLWCDTDFVKGTKYSEDNLIISLENLSEGWYKKCVVFTGGEPLLQLKKEKGLSLIKKLFSKNWTVCIETNGTIDNEVTKYLFTHPNGHITVSPKPLMSFNGKTDHIYLRYGTDLKIVIPTCFNLEKLKNWNFSYYYLQPMDAKDEGTCHSNFLKSLELSKKYGYVVSIQTHKYVGIE